MRKYIPGRKTFHRPRSSYTEQEFRVRLPKEGEIFGKVEGLHGSKHLTIKCADGKIRMCRIPGKLRKIWVREEDFVLIKPWEIEGDKKGDIVWRYRQVETDWLRRNDYLKDL